MKLSEAMRTGAKFGPQLYGRLTRGDGGSCAMGAAYMGRHGSSACGDIFVLTRYSDFNVITSMSIETMPCGCSGSVDINSDPALGPVMVASTLWYAIVHLNNFHKWSREAIAEWVETIENKLEERMGDGGGQESGANQTPTPAVPEKTTELYPAEVK